MTVAVDSFRQARNYYAGRNKPVRLIVLHDMETDEALTDAEAVGNYFASPTAPRASAHVGVDADSTVGYVRPSDTAFGAAGANSDGFHIEQSGRARQSRDEWLDERSRATIWRAAKAGFEAARDFGIPRRRLTVAEVADGVTKGFTDHRTVEKAFPSYGHYDPGEFYPWDVFLADMESFAGAPGEGDDMAPPAVVRLADDGKIVMLPADGGKANLIPDLVALDMVKVFVFHAFGPNPLPFSMVSITDPKQCNAVRAML